MTNFHVGISMFSFTRTHTHMYARAHAIVDVNFSNLGEDLENFLRQILPRFTSLRLYLLGRWKLDDVIVDRRKIKLPWKQTHETGRTSFDWKNA